MIELTPDRKLNLDKLQKGDYLSEELLRTVTGFDPNENYQTYAFAVLKIRDTLRKERKLFTRGEGFAIRILTDNEATYYKSNRARIHRKGQQRDYEDLTSLDEGEMDEVTRQQHRKHIDEASRYLSAQQGISKQIRVQRTQETLRRTHQEQSITITSMKGEMKNGTTANDNKTERNGTDGATQRMDGESAAPAGQGHEEAHEQAQ